MVYLAPTCELLCSLILYINESQTPNNLEGVIQFPTYCNQCRFEPLAYVWLMPKQCFINYYIDSATSQVQAPIALCNGKR